MQLDGKWKVEPAHGEDRDDYLREQGIQSVFIVPNKVMYIRFETELIRHVSDDYNSMIKVLFHY